MTDKNESISKGEPNPEFNNPIQPENKPKVKRGKKKFIIGSLIILFLVTGIVGLGFANGFRDKHKGDGHFRFMLNKVADQLNLTDQQKTEVNKIKDEIKSKMDEKQKDRMDHATEFEQMFRGDTFDKQKMIDFAKMREANREEMRTFMVDEMAKFHALLTPDQRNKAADLMKEHREKMGKFKDGNRGPGKNRDKWEKD